MQKRTAYVAGLFFSLVWLTEVSAIKLQPLDKDKEGLQLSEVGGSHPDVRGRDKPSYKSLGHYWMPPADSNFTLNKLIAAKSIDKQCWWVEHVSPDDKADRVAPLAVDTNRETTVVEMLGSSLMPGDHQKKKEDGMMSNEDCILREVQTVADRVIVPLDDPVTRILEGVALHLEGHEPTHPQYKFFARKSFRHNFLGGADKYVGALRDVTHDLHEKAMRLTFCEDCQNYMLPIKGFYIRPGDDLTNVEFVCNCKLSLEMHRVAARWGFMGRLDTSDSEDLRTNFTITLNDENRQWVEETYAEDLALYKEHCGQICSTA